MDQPEGANRRRGGLFAKLAQASEMIQRTATSASEVLVDKELRRKAGSKLVQGIQGGIQEFGSKADAVRRNVIQNVGDSWTHGRRGAQGVLESVQAQLHQHRLKRALSQSRGQHVDIQIGFNVYLEVPQEMRSRLWLVILREPSLAVPFQELGRFPDLGTFDMESVTPYGGRSGEPPSQDQSMHSGSGPRQPSSRSEMTPFVTQPKAAAHKLSAELLESHAAGPDGQEADTEAAGGDGGKVEPRLPLRQSQESIANLSDACTDDDAATGKNKMGASSAMIRGGEVSSTTAVDGAPEEQDMDKKRASEEEWEVVEKAETLRDSSYVGPATFANSVTNQSEPPAAAATSPAAASASEQEAEAQRQQDAMGAAGIGEDSAQRVLPVGRKLEDANRRRLESQEATALKMRVSEDRIKTAIIAVKWPVDETVVPGSKYATLLQVTVGQEEVEDIISRDIHRTFPQHPQFLLGQGQEELFNVLKAYSLTDMEVGYCQGMAFVAGILLMYMPEQLAFQLFCTLMSKDGPNLRRYYLDGLSDLKHEMAMFEWLLSRHHPRLAKHLQEHCIPCVLYVSQWLLTVFACPFPAFFTAQLIDIMLLENSDRIIMQTCMAIMAEVEERLLRTDNFEDIITCLKSDPAQWSDDKLRGLLTAAYLSSVSETELKLASDSVASVAAASHSRKSSHTAAAQAGDLGKGASGEAPEVRQAGETQPDSGEVEGAAAGACTSEAGDGRNPSMGGLVEFEDLMKKELQQLTWAGPSGTAGQSKAAEASLSTPAALGDAVREPKSVLRLSADVGAATARDGDGHLGRRAQVRTGLSRSRSAAAPVVVGAAAERAPSQPAPSLAHPQTEQPSPGSEDAS